MASVRRKREYADQLKARRHNDRSDDLVSTILNAQDSGGRLSLNEHRNLYHILVFAGNETTRTALSHGAIALADNPCLLYTSPSPRDKRQSRMPSSA